MARPAAGGKKRERAGATRRTQILLAARTLIAEHGVAETSIRMLASQVGVSEGALYRHFASKEEIIEDLLTQEAALFHDSLVAALSLATVAAPTADPWLRLDTLVAAFIEFGRGEPESFRLIVELHVSPGARFHPRGRKPRTLFLEAISRIEAGESARFADPVAIAVMLVGLLSRLIGAERGHELKLTPAEVVQFAQHAARAVVNACRLPGGPRKGRPSSEASGSPGRRGES